MNNMLKTLLISCLLIACPYIGNSQTTSTLTREQLVTANLIFAEHAKLSKEVPLLKQQINNLEFINNMHSKVDSIRLQQINAQSEIINKQNESINKLNKSIKTNKKIITYGSLGAVILIVIGFLK